jgi:integrase
MGILAECPFCHTKQGTKNKVCKCGQSLDKAKRAKKVKYWISYKLPDGKVKRESVDTIEGLSGCSIEDARDAFAQKRVHKREKKLFDVKKDTEMTFNQLTEWYLELEKVKALASFDTIQYSLDKFNKVFGDRIVCDVKLAEVENYQAKRQKVGLADGTIDHETGKTKTMIFKAFDNDMVSGSTLKTFKRVKKLLVHGSDVRDRIISSEEFEALIKHAPDHLKGIIAMGYYTGMRRGEILKLTWDKVDLANRMIRLKAGDTKDKQARNIPIVPELFKMLSGMPNRLRKEDSDDHVFLFKGKRLSCIRTGLRRTCKDAGIVYGRNQEGGFTFHDLRHTFNTNMRKAGVQESVIMEITGHSTREMFDRYNSIDEDDTRSAIDQLEGYLSKSYQTSYQKRGKRNLIRNTSRESRYE